MYLGIEMNLNAIRSLDILDPPTKVGKAEIDLTGIRHNWSRKMDEVRALAEFEESDHTPIEMKSAQKLKYWTWTTKSDDGHVLSGSSAGYISENGRPITLDIQKEMMLIANTGGGWAEAIEKYKILTGMK
jgi:hypothetical protein